MLNQNAEEPFNGAEQRAVQHNRLVLFAVFADIGNVKTLRQVHVDLNCAALPFAADGVAEDEFQFRTVESALAFVDFILVAMLFQCARQRLFGNIPDFVGTDTLFRTGRKVNLYLVKAEVLIDVKNQLHCRDAFFFHLFGRAEDVRIVLRELAHPH